MSYDKNTVEFVPMPTRTNGRPFQNLTGQRSGRLTVLGFAGTKKRTTWFCECECGKIVRVTGLHLSTQHTKSCGCLNAEKASTLNLRHGETKGGRVTPEFRAFAHAKDRCESLTNKSYEDYGGRGIKFCFDDFPSFLDAVGRRPSSRHSLERIDNERHYEPGNLKWATRPEQARNKRNTVYLTARGTSLPLADWADITGVAAGSIHSRKVRGWCDACSLLPLYSRCPHIAK